MQKTKKILFVLIAIVTILGTLAINTFAYTDIVSGHQTPISKVIPSATAVVAKTGGITQTPTAIAKNPYSNGELYVGGNVDNSVRVHVYSDDYYSDNYGVTGRSLHYVFTSANPFSFYIDLGCIPRLLSNSGNHIFPDSAQDVATFFNFSYKMGGASAINSVNNPYQFFEPESGDRGLFYGCMDLDSNLHTFVDDAFSLDYRVFEYEPQYVTGANYISGYIDADVGNFYNFVDIQICIKEYGSNLGYFNGVDTNCDMLTDYMIKSLADYNVESAYDDGYSIGYVDGENQGLSDGYDIGWDVGHNTGFNEGYKDGQDNFIDDKGLFAFVIDSIDALFSFPLFDLPDGGTISLGLILGTIVGALIFVWILKLIAGG